MKTSDFYYDLPKELIAQTPLEPRDSSRLLVLDREKQTLEHKHFYDIIDYLNEGDLLVANDSRVLPARIYGIKDETGARVEFLLLKQIANNRWETLCKPGKKARVGTKFSFGNGILRATVVDVKDDGNRIVDFDCEENFLLLLTKSVRCLFLLILLPSLKTRSAIRRFTAMNSVLRQLRRQDFTLQPSLWTESRLRV